MCRTGASGGSVPTGCMLLSDEAAGLLPGEFRRAGSGKGEQSAPAHGDDMAPPSGHGLLPMLVLGTFALGRLTRGQENSTLIFTRENTIRNCSCSADVRDCDDSLASLVCSCKTVLPRAAPPTSYSGHLTVWFTDTSALGLLLNFTRVRDLKLSLCGSNTLPPGYLAVCGLQRLRVSAVAKPPSPEQSLLVRGGGDRGPGDRPVSLRTGRHACTYVSFLDVTLFNRASSLKSYSIENVAASSLPNFSPFKNVPLLSNDSYVVTFIY